MAEVVTVDGEQYTKRGPLGAWGLTLVTVGIYGFVWYYKINDEARRYLRDESIKPGIALLAVLLGWIIIVPPFISYYRTGERISRMQDKAALQQRIVPALGLLAALVLALHVVYMQGELNKVWDRSAGSGPSGSAQG